MDKIQIQRYIYALLYKETLTESEINETLNNKEVMEYIITKTTKKTFDKIMKLLNSPIEFIEQRTSYEKNAISNINNSDDNHKIDIISQIYFGDCATNILFTIETTLERIETSKEFEKNFNEQTINFLRKLHTFLKERKTTNLEEFIKDIELYQEELKTSNNTISKLIEKLFLLAQNSFLEELKNGLNNSNILEGIKPTTIKNKDGKEAQLYTLQKQTEYQTDFYMLVRTNDIQNYMKEENATEELLKNMSQRKYLSYSINNGELYQSYAGKNRITFGYFTLGNNTLMSANTHDGNTNQYTLTDNFYVLKQQYLELTHFMAKTEGYNEIVVKNNDPLIPSCIVVNEPTTSDEIINIASSMNLPIVYLDPKYYKKHIPVNPVTEKERLENWYQHEYFLKYSLGNTSTLTIPNI